MAHILIVDDEEDIAQLVARYAEFEGHEATCASDGREAVELCRRQVFDAIVLDIMMPGMDGYTACKQIRDLQDTPVIMLSALGEEYDKLMGFSLGIVDYVVKPFSPKELMARIKVAIGRREPKDAPTPSKTLRCGAICVDTAAHTASVNREPVALTAKEYDLLVFFMRHKGIALTREEILQAVWGYDFYGDGRTVDWQVKLLRGKLGEERRHIVTLRGVGYRFED